VHVSEPFESAEFSIRRAVKHAVDFHTLAAKFVNGESYTTRDEFNAETGLNEIKVKLVRDFPEDLRGSLSDAIKNIRDSLDQAVSAATLVVTGKRRSRTHFPFGESEDDLENSLSRRKAAQCKDIPEEIFPAIRFIRPYPHEGDSFRLKTLQRVSGPHKHSVSLSLGCSPAYGFSEVTLNTGDPSTSITINFPEWDSSKEEVVVATYAPKSGGRAILSHAFYIAVDHPELRNIPASVVLEGWGRRADWVVQGLKKFAAQVVAERG